MMSLTGQCLCGAVALTLPALHDDAVNCNCSICRRAGALWAYYPAETLVVAGATAVWQRPAGAIPAFDHCPSCGWMTHWRGLAPPADARVGVDLQLFDGFAPWTARITRVDGANDAWGEGGGEGSDDGRWG